MTRQAYHRARKRRERWQGQVATHLARLEELLTGTWPDGTFRRPPEATVPPLPAGVRQALEQDWGLRDSSEPPF